MKKGISFLIANRYGSYLGEVLKPFNTTDFNWLIGGEESYFVEDDTLGKPLFPEDSIVLDGKILKNIIEKNEYYLIFADLKAYPKGNNPADIKTYDEFLKSNCQLVLLVVDTIYMIIYCKDSEKLESLFQNAKLKGFEDLQYITDENDTIERLSCW
ncbi:hypothetical protein QE429_000881 [Bacillus sp. SORGH_AS 510]|uniref:DUF2691 family protein n=1 Tax=Bacillus sp. SORGH_AS_0510 TaxID=3041771 RepID=UPI002783324F|nr:DUF2691 family protein [Bacillus sp. SORGH_AS_0510]MDQ1144054.1 hypothetical protein [Bacillus sp. SORGH_AS_0510]